MASITLEEELGSNGFLSSFYSSVTLGFTIKGDKSASLEDSFGASVNFTGKDFSFDGGAATAGKVTAITFYDQDANLLMTIAGAKLKLVDFNTTSLFDMQNAFQTGNDTITGTKLGDTLGAGLNAGNDTLLGLAGDDYLFGSAGNNIIDGGKGIDTLNYESAGLDAKVKHGITLDATKGTVTNPWEGHDTFKNIERFLATGLNDTMKGSSRDEYFDGMGGKDTITGGGGADTFEFSLFSGKDTIKDFGNGADVIHISVNGIASIDDLAMSTKGGNAVIMLDADTTLTLIGVKASALVEADFDFGF